MPAIHDASVNAHTEVESASSVSFGFTVTSGATLLVVAVFVDANSDNNPTASSSVDGALTALSGGEVIGASAAQCLAVFYKVNPTVGAHTITGDWDNTLTPGAAIAVTFDATNTSTPIANATTDSGSDTTVSSTVPSVGASDLVIDFLAVNSNPALTAGANQTELEENSTGTSGGTMYGMSSQAGADGGVMSWTWTGTQRTAQVAFRLPVAAGGTDDLLANDVQSTSNVTTPAVGQKHVLLANDVQSTSNVTAPALHQVHALLANDVQSTSNVTTPAIGQKHVLLANDVESASEVSAPALAENEEGVNNLLANDVQSTSQVSTPALGQVHVLTAEDVESDSLVSSPVLDAPITPPSVTVTRRTRAPLKYVPTKSPINADPVLRGYVEREFQAVARTMSASSDLSGVAYVSSYGVTGAGDEQATVQAALDSGATIVDGQWTPVTINSSVEIPAGVTFRNADITAGAAGIDLVLVNSRSRFMGKLTGTGATSAVSRGIYPAADGVEAVVLDVEVRQLTYGVHAQYITTDTEPHIPKRWSGNVYAHEIVGTAGDSEGYAILLSPAHGCRFNLIAKDIARHAVYLSAGAKANRVLADVDGCANYAVQLFSTAGQNETRDNVVVVTARNLTENVAGQSGAFAIVGKAHYNTVVASQEGDGNSEFFGFVDGASGGPYPTGNRVIDGGATGEFKGTDVLKMRNADSTIVRGNIFAAFATDTVIAMRRSGTNGAQHGGWIDGNVIDALGNNCKGIYDEINAQPSYLGPNEIRNTGAAVEVDDQSGGNAVIGV